MIVPGIIRLKCLLKEGVVTRRLYSEHPPRGEYILTAKGHALGVVVGALANWGDHYTEHDVTFIDKECGHGLSVGRALFGVVGAWPASGGHGREPCRAWRVRAARRPPGRSGRRRGSRPRRSARPHHVGAVRIVHAYLAGSTATGSRWASWWPALRGVASTARIPSSSTASERAPLPASTVSSASSQCS